MRRFYVVAETNYRIVEASDEDAALLVPESRSITHWKCGYLDVIDGPFETELDGFIGEGEAVLYFQNARKVLRISL